MWEQVLLDLFDLIYYCHMYWDIVKSIVFCEVQTKHTVHGVLGGEGEGAECSVAVIAKV